MKPTSTTTEFLPGAWRRAPRPAWRRMIGVLLIALMSSLTPLALVPPEVHGFEQLYTPGCEAYPITFHVSNLEGLQPDDDMGDIYNGFGPGNFGWLRWSLDLNDGNEGYLIQEIYNPGLAVTDFEDAKEPGDMALSLYDWVYATTGLSKSSDARDALNWLMTRPEIRVLVWDISDEAGVDGAYHIVSFAQVRITGHLLPGQNRLSAQFLGWEDDACPEVYPDLGIAKSASASRVWPGEGLTYTLSFSNTGPARATGVVISDALPGGLTAVGFTYSGAAITPTAGVTYAWRVQDLLLNESGLITVTGQVPAVLPVDHTLVNTATITGTWIETATANNTSSVTLVYDVEKLYLPIILRYLLNNSG